MSGGETRNALRILVGKPEWKRQLITPRYIWKKIKINIEEKGCECRLETSGSGWEPVAGSCEHGNEHQGSVKDEGSSS
jgi:hypothetical protein